MSHFKAKMHQIRFRLGLHQNPLGELTIALNYPVRPDPLSSRRVPKVTPSKNPRSSTAYVGVGRWDVTIVLHND